MSDAIGRSLPEDLLAQLDGSRPEEQRGKIVVVTTVDDDGFPHISLLSFGELLATSDQEIRLALFASGHTLRNIVVRSCVTLVFLDTGIAYYVRGTGCEIPGTIEAGPTQPFEARIVSIRVDQVLADAEVGAWITTAARYERAIAAREEVAEWHRVWNALRAE